MTRTTTMQGYTWTGGINADRVARLNVETGEWSFYLLPFEANIRDINLAARRAPAACQGSGSATRIRERSR